MLSWQPSASIQNLKKRALLLQTIRMFFANKAIWEVETPVLAHATVTNPYIESFRVYDRDKYDYYLQTSPEYHMKRLLAAGSGAIYQISKAFRQDEVGPKHNPEFTLLEWYQPHMHYHELMDEVAELLAVILKLPTLKMTYQSLFEEFIDCNPFTLSKKQCAHIATKHNINISASLSVDEWLDLFMTHVIEPNMPVKKALFIYDFPASQAALASIRQGKPRVAERFEVYVNGVELANGFQELTDPKEQEQRFKQDLQKRLENKQHTPCIDQRFIHALNKMPRCSGVALGVDRLMMLAMSANSLQEVQSFPVSLA